mgnify:CR=1 FL=1
MNPKEIKIKMTSDIIQVSADQLWRIVGPGFGDVGTWTSSVDRSTGTGIPQFSGAPCSDRVCHVNISGYDKICEKITYYDHNKQQMAYEITDGVPGFVLLARNHWTIREVGKNQSVAEMNCTMRLSPLMGMLLGGVMKRKVTKNLEEVFQELKAYAEKGELSSKKRKRMLELNRAEAL